MFSIVFHPEARDELQTSAGYYEDEVTGLGGEFLDEIERAMSRMQEFPDSGTPFSSHTRRYLVDRFPFAIIYSLETNRILIIAIMHLHRKPGYWRDRI